MASSNLAMARRPPRKINRTGVGRHGCVGHGHGVDAAPAQLLTSAASMPAHRW